jgi:arabinan endo-1,5-alpha-L-arabinosidase
MDVKTLRNHWACRPLQRMIPAICCTVLGISITGARINAQYVNPLKGDLGVHDPAMIREGAAYFIFATGRLIAAKTSTDHITWRNAGSGLVSPGWIKTYVPANNGTDFWAPDISFRNNKYWLYYSVSTFGSNVSAIGLATSPSLANPVWTDQGMVIRSVAGDNYNCIDPNFFQDTDGKTYLLFGSFWSGIKMAEVDSITGKPAAGTSAIASLASHANGIEAPFLFKWGSYYYLFVSWDRCCNGCSSTYKIAAGRATSVKGPYLSRSGTAMSAGGGDVLDTGDAIRKGPGHNGIFVEHDTVFCVNHYYACNSLLQIRPVYFDNGWPSFVGTRTNPYWVNAAGRQDVRTPEFASRVRVAFTPPPSGLKGCRIYTISGRRVFRDSRTARDFLPREILIIDFRK